MLFPKNFLGNAGRAVYNSFEYSAGSIQTIIAP